MSVAKFSAQQLKSFATNVYLTVGLKESQAALISDSLVQADLWGHQSHGVMRTFWYATRIQSGATNALAEPIIVTDSGAIAVMDGENGAGQVIAQVAMQQAIVRAKAHGIGAVAVRNSGHFGTAMYFTSQAAKAGCVGFLSTNASPAMAPWGGREKLIGTNPWSIAAPAGKYPLMMLDIANTAVARGKLYLAKQRGEPIPLGWAIDPDGNPTTDPVAGIAGNILPFAGHKGYAIATMMDVLSGVLSGSRFADGVIGPYESKGQSGVGHLAVALNISAFRPLEDFNADMETLVAKIKNAPKAPGTGEIFYPGEIEARNEQRQLVEDIVIPADTIAELDSDADKLGVPTLSSFR